MHFVLPNHSAVKEIMLLLFQQGWLLQFYILRYCIIVLEMYIYSQALLGIATCQPSFLSAQEVIWILSWPHYKNVGLDLDMGPLTSLSLFLFTLYHCGCFVAFSLLRSEMKGITIISLLVKIG